MTFLDSKIAHLDAQITTVGTQNGIFRPTKLCLKYTHKMTSLIPKKSYTIGAIKLKVYTSKMTSLEIQSEIIGRNFSVESGSSMEWNRIERNGIVWKRPECQNFSIFVHLEIPSE